jgi:hypothetical protein
MSTIYMEDLKSTTRLLYHGIPFYEVINITKSYNDIDYF